MERQNRPQKRCLFCGRYFRPEKQVGDRQISCLEIECQRKRRLAQQLRWKDTNPGYFKGRYEYLKEWRKANPGYQKLWRAKITGKRASEIQTSVPGITPINTIRLNTRANVDLGEIQTLVLTVTKRGQALWVTGAGMQPG